MSDSISRKAVIRWVKAECNPYGKPTLDFESGKKVIEHLEQMPSTDRPTGEWIEVEDYAGGIHYQCDKCKEEFILMYGTPKENGYNYCPACGAKMEEKNEQS